MPSQFKQQAISRFLSCGVRRRALPALMLAGLVSGCGGGSRPATTPDTSDVFIDAAGPLCGRRDTETGYCIQPTSSSATLEVLQAALTDPKGEQFEMASFGWTRDSSQTLTGLTYTAGSNDYSMLNKNLVVGKNQIIADGKTYSYSKPYLGGSQFLAGEEQTNVWLSWAGALNLGQVYNGTQSGEPGTFVTYGGTQWFSTVGLLTDKIDAPVDQHITYTGLLSIYAGDGSIVGGYPSYIWGGCPITLDFNASNGELTASPVKCDSTGPNIDSSTVQFDLPPLFFKNSRVGPLIGRSASIAIAGNIDNNVNAPVSALFDATKIEGALYSAGAQYLSVIGAGTLGSFQITAVRK